jgi:predicted permease
VTTDLGLAGLDEARSLAAVDQLLERVRALPGASSATVASMVPLGFGGHSFSSVRVEGYVPAPNEESTIERVVVGDGYFETVGVPILEGRAITAGDTLDQMPVAVVNEAFARRYWPGQPAIGRRFDLGFGPTTVVGVARNAAYRDLGETPYPLAYLPLRQRYAPGITLHVRTAGDPRALAEPVRAELARVSADLPFLSPRTMADHFGASTFVQSLGASMLGAFGSLALVLAAVGLYGVLAYTVAQRGREIAIRVALGAAPGDVLRLVVAQGLRVTAVGLVVGAVLALGAGRLLRGQLLGVPPTDPLTFASIALLLSAVALVASVVPALRGLRVDPVTALKSE